MWARALALTATALLAARCMPSGDLASYSSGADGQEGTPGPEDQTAGAGGTVEPPPVAMPGAGATEGGVMPGGLQGGSGDGSGNGGSPPAVGPEPDEPTPPEDPVVVPEAPQFRFVRLIADSDLTAGPLTSVAEFNVLDAEGEPLDRAGWSVEADSEEQVFVGGAQAGYAIDGEPTTMWHTPWYEVEPPPHPHFLDVDLGEPRSIGGFRYLPRQDGALDGGIAAYRFFVSVDGVEWGEAVASGTFPSSALEQEVRLTP